MFRPHWFIINLASRTCCFMEVRSHDFLCYVDRPSVYNLVNKSNQVHNSVYYIHLLLFCTCFGASCAHHQGKIVVSMRYWYLSLCMCGDWSDGWIESNQQTSRHPYRVTNTSVAGIQKFSPDNWHVDDRNMQRREINKCIKHNCAPSWTYLRDEIIR